MVRRYPIQLQATYSDLVSRVQEAEHEGLSKLEGSYAAKKVNGKRYWYFRRRHGGRIDERYMGPETPELLAEIEQRKLRIE